MFSVSVTAFDMKEYTSDLKSNNNFGSAMEHYISDLKGPQLNKEGMVLIKIHSDETSLISLV